MQARLQILFDDTDPDALHRAQPLMGQCKNFKPTGAGPNKMIPLGSVRYMRPTDAFTIERWGEYVFVEISAQHP